jgi:hypothetical protein
VKRAALVQGATVYETRWDKYGCVHIAGMWRVESTLPHAQNGWHGNDPRPVASGQGVLVSNRDYGTRIKQLRTLVSETEGLAILADDRAARERKIAEEDRRKERVERMQTKVARLNDLLPFEHRVYIGSWEDQCKIGESQIDTILAAIERLAQQ